MKKYQLIFTIIDTTDGTNFCTAKSVEIETKTFRQAFFEGLGMRERIEKEYNEKYHPETTMSMIYVFLADIINKKR